MEKLVKVWFSTANRIAALQSEAVRWEGTPFFPNSCACGPRGGVSCQKLVGALYRGVGFCDVDIPDVPMSHARFNRDSLVEAFMANRPEFLRFAVADVPTVRPGDLLGFRLHRTVHHLGVCVWEGVFVHAIEGLGVTQSALEDATWSSRLEALWRPIEL